MIMRYNLIIFISTILIGCGSIEPKTSESSVVESPASRKLLKTVTPSYRDTYALGSTVKIGYVPVTEIDSAHVVVNGKLIEGGEFKLSQDRVGRMAYRVTVFKGDDKDSMDGEFLVTSAVAPQRRSIKVKNSYPHSPEAYTQGLLFHDGRLYESTGQRGSSSLRQTDIASGKVLKKIDLDKKYFGEGLALLGEKLYQLTWEEGVVLVYDLQSFEKTGQFPISGEGWGVTTDGTYLYVSDGSNRITKYDPDGFRKVSHIEVMDNRQRIMYLNELEWIGGKIWANVYTTNLIAVIDPESGVVESYIDCSELIGRIGNSTQEDEVLNGIACDPKTGRVWLTGKNWDKLFEVSVD